MSGRTKSKTSSAAARRPSGGKKLPRQKFPFWALLILTGSIYLFWIWPNQQGPQPVSVDFGIAK